MIYFSVIFKNFVWYVFLYIKGETFREILHLGEIWSLLPDSVHVMALTATITKSVRLELEKFLEMRDAVSVVLNPCKSNIMIFVSEYRSIPKTFAPLLYKLRNERTMCPRTIIYCRSLDDFANFYLYFKSETGQDFTEPCGAPTQLSKYRLVDMFTECTDEAVKNQILLSFTKDSCLRVVCATIAFGMGVDCPDIWQVVRFGPPDDLRVLCPTDRSGWKGWSTISSSSINKEGKLKVCK